jgi:hypothetical protein
LQVATFYHVQGTLTSSVAIVRLGCTGAMTKGTKRSCLPWNLARVIPVAPEE